MGLFDKMNNKRFEKRLKENSNLVYEMINNANQYYFNQGLISANEMNRTSVFTRTMQENVVWNQGIVENLEWFYRHTYSKLSGFRAETKPAQSYFWAKVTNKTVRVHSGIPALISKTMVNMIAGPGMKYTVNDGENEETERLDIILKENEFQDTLFPTGVNMASYGGYFGWKLSVDKSISEYPILEFVRPENVEVIQKRGRNVGYVYKSVFEENEDTYELHEIYTKDENGTPIITYTMFVYDGAELREVALNEEEYQTIVFNGLDEIPAGIVNNTAANQQFKGSPYGQSDYNNSQPLFNAMDEILSQEMTALRYARPKRFISTDLIPENATGVKGQFDDFEGDYEMVEADKDNPIQNTYQGIDHKIDVIMYSSAASRFMTRILANAGLDASTVGLIDAKDVATDGDSLREREKTSLRTREMKLKIIRKELVRMFRIVLKFDDVMDGKTASEYEVAVKFNDFSIPSFEERSKLARENLNGGIADVKMAVDTAYLDDLTDEEKESMVKNIKIENGVPLTVDEVDSTT